MRFLAFFLVIVCLIGCRSSKIQYSRSGFEPAQISTVEFPFQVLHAEGVRLVGSDYFLARLNFVGNSDFIKVLNGHLILVHYSGKFLEFEKDTILNVSELNEKLKSDIHLASKTEELRPDVDMLFSHSQVYSGFICRPVPYVLNFIGDEFSTIESRSDDICVAWEVYENDRFAPYEVSVKNIYDENVATFLTEQSSIQLDLSPFDSVLVPGLAIIQVVSVKDDIVSTSPIGIRLVEYSSYLPSACKLNSAIEVLEFACYLKWLGSHHASAYFKLAGEMSNKVVYQELKGWNDR